VNTVGQALSVEVRRAGGVFYMKFEDGSKAYVYTETEGGVIKILETYVPEKYRGKGYAKVLVDNVVEYARNGGLKILPICSYAISYFARNKELRDLLVEDFRNLSDKEWEELYKKRLEEEASKSRKA
jgi:predicted GNAT family acetyltransferase